MVILKVDAFIYEESYYLFMAYKINIIKINKYKSYNIWRFWVSLPHDSGRVEPSSLLENKIIIIT